MLAVSAQIHRPEICFNQTHQCLDNVSFMKPITKYAAQIESIEEIPTKVFEALAATIEGIPGPAYLSFPVDVMQQKIDEKTANQLLNRLSPLKKAVLPAPQKDEFNQLLASLKTAKHPIAIVGNQVIR